MRDETTLNPAHLLVVDPKQAKVVTGGSDDHLGFLLGSVFRVVCA